VTPDALPAVPISPENLLGKSAGELRSLCVAMGEPQYRGGQLYRALYVERRFDFAEMSNLPAELRGRLSRDTAIRLPEIIRRHHSEDGTVRYVMSLGTHQNAFAPQAALPAHATNIETVFMPEKTRQTICVSTQAGCAVDCHFCLTATLGLIRNISAGEILGQIIAALADHREELHPQTNVVLMGQGEPLLNYDPVFAALRILLDPAGMAISPKHVTLSTSGIVPGIERMALEPVRPKLAISLNASHDAQRDEIMPVNRKYPLAELLRACRDYPLRTWEHLTFEYVLLGGFNDTPEDARRVVKLLNNMRAKVNLIPWNAGELPYRTAGAAQIEEFRRILTGKGLATFVRYSRGQDVMAACGQLALLESNSPASGLSQIAPSAP
jgi:23S rRNA (adenine2503-C2)-methyltransferase